MDAKTFFTELLKEYGVYTTVIVIVVLYVARDLWNRFSEKLFSSFKEPPLKDHTAFKDFDRIINHTLVSNFNCECPIRKAIYRDILIERMKCFRDKLYEFVQTDMNSKELYPTQHDFYLKVASLLDSANLESKKNSIANGIPEFIVDNLEKERKPIRVVIGDMLKVACYSEYNYRNNADRMRVILSFVIVFCKNYMDTLEKSLASYNGDIKGLKYNGISCQNCKVCIHDEFIKKQKATLSK